MGDYIHRTMIVEGLEDDVREAHTLASQILGAERVTPVMRTTNGYHAFYVVDCGGREGGVTRTEDLHDRNDLKNMLGGRRAAWYEVTTGEAEPAITDSWRNWR
jgi:hypothetical protein